MIDDNFFSTKENEIKDRRAAIRHASGNYKAVATLKQLLGKKKYINIKVINISTKGARISSRYNFSVKEKITLNFKVLEGETWKISAKIVGSYSNLEYGIFFDTLQFDLMDQLIAYEAGLK